MPSQPRKTNIPTSLTVNRIELITLEFQPIEDDQDRALRLHKELISFYVKDVGTLLLGFFFVIIIGICCFSILIREEPAPTDKSRAWSALSVILGGTVGFLLGKLTKSRGGFQRSAREGSWRLR
jgi:hypothetical protein